MDHLSPHMYDCKPLGMPSTSTLLPTSPTFGDAYDKNRDRIVMACVHCRKRKSKCDGTRPGCGPCRRASRPCRYEPVCERDSWAAKMRKKRDRQRNAVANMAVEAERSRQAFIEAMCLTGSHPNVTMVPHPFINGASPSPPITRDSSDLFGAETHNMGLGLALDGHSPPSPRSAPSPTSPFSYSPMTRCLPLEMAPVLAGSEWTSVMPPPIGSTAAARSPTGSAQRSCRISLSSHSSCSSLSTSSSFSEPSSTISTLPTVLQHLPAAWSPLDGLMTPMLTPEPSDSTLDHFWGTTPVLGTEGSEATTPLLGDPLPHAGTGLGLDGSTSVMALAMSLLQVQPSQQNSFSSTISHALQLPVSPPCSEYDGGCSSSSSASSPSSSSLYAALQFHRSA